MSASHAAAHIGGPAVFKASKIKLREPKVQSQNLTQGLKFQINYAPIYVTRVSFDLMFYQPSITMRLYWQVLAIAVIFFATPSVAEPFDGRRLLDHVQNPDRIPDNLETFTPSVILVSDETKRQEPDTDIFALMSGKCSTLKVAGRDFACKAVAYFHSKQGRTNFMVALDDPADDAHVISFSGENGQRAENYLYELPVDRMLLNSKERPKVDGLPVPFVELSAGICKQLGNFATRQVSSVSCTAMDKNGKKYELQFESDGSPIVVRRVSQSPPTIVQHPFAKPNFAKKLVEPNAVAPEYREAAEKRRAEQIEQLECRHKADVAKVLHRDLTTYIIQCLVEVSQKPTTAAQP